MAALLSSYLAGVVGIGLISAVIVIAWPSAERAEIARTAATITLLWPLIVLAIFLDWIIGTFIRLAGWVQRR